MKFNPFLTSDCSKIRKCISVPPRTCAGRSCLLFPRNCGRNTTSAPCPNPGMMRSTYIPHLPRVLVTQLCGVWPLPLHENILCAWTWRSQGTSGPEDSSKTFNSVNVLYQRWSPEPLKSARRSLVIVNKINQWFEDTTKVSKLPRSFRCTERNMSSTSSKCSMRRLMAQPSMWAFTQAR